MLIIFLSKIDLINYIKIKYGDCGKILFLFIYYFKVEIG